jgi:hypothetical protein
MSCELVETGGAPVSERATPERVDWIYPEAERLVPEAFVKFKVGKVP